MVHICLSPSELCDQTSVGIDTFVVIGTSKAYSDHFGWACNDILNVILSSSSDTDGNNSSEISKKAKTISKEQELLQSLPHMMPTSTATSTRKQFKKRSRKQPQQKGSDGKKQTLTTHNKDQEPTHREETVPLNDISATTSMQNSSSTISMQNSSSTTSMQNSASTSTFQTSSSTSLDYQDDDQQQQKEQKKQEQECSSSLWKGKSPRGTFSCSLTCSVTVSST